MNKKSIFPFQPDDYMITYTSLDNPFMRSAMECAREFSKDNFMPTGSVVVKNDRVIGQGANGSDYHSKKPCERVLRNIPTGDGYELCEGCHPKNHSERRAIHKAQIAGHDTSEADLFLFGHWWCCEPCWDAIRHAKIKNVFLLQASEILFNKNDPRNIVGRQFEIL